jgi:hypothetical protein
VEAHAVIGSIGLNVNVGDNGGGAGACLAIWLAEAMDGPLNEECVIVRSITAARWLRTLRVDIERGHCEIQGHGSS